MANALHKQGAVAAKEAKYAAYLVYERNIYSQKPDIALLLPTLQLLQKALAAEGDQLGEIHLLVAMYRAYPHDPQVAVDLKKAVLTSGFKIQSIIPRIPTSFRRGPASALQRPCQKHRIFMSVTGSAFRRPARSLP
ncbi:hypothetical protein [Acidithiobacillus marinus]|uniref:hypothetical protein n=1 Tax=Acidithiobacillus marinus TaxID=187490 RepID=UPI00209C5E77|nr:hypothetical protein [Acidithiobacillus marinus]